MKPRTLCTLGKTPALGPCFLSLDIICPAGKSDAIPSLQILNVAMTISRYQLSIK
jgi:hypothetical protein